MKWVETGGGEGKWWEKVRRSCTKVFIFTFGSFSLERTFILMVNHSNCLSVYSTTNDDDHDDSKSTALLPVLF